MPRDSEPTYSNLRAAQTAGSASSSTATSASFSSTSSATSAVDPKPQPLDVRELVSLGLVESAAAMSHTVDRVRFPDSTTVWYRKEIETPVKARREWLAQEFLRLIIPNQTETRLGYKPESNVYFILSKEVPGFRPLPLHEPSKFTDGTYTGLGHAITGAYFIHEADLKNGNIGLNKDNVVFKIDGDWSFASMRSGGQFPKISGAIAAAQINRLPFPMTYKAYNWLDIFIEGSLASESEIVSSDITSNAQFQQEKFETLFKLLLIPDNYFSKFVDAFMPAGAKEYSDFLIERRTTLLKHALRIDGFAKYINDNKAKLAEMAESFQKQMKNFVVQGNYHVLKDSEHTRFTNHAKVQFHQVLATFNLPPSYSEVEIAAAGGGESAVAPTADDLKDRLADSYSEPSNHSAEVTSGSVPIINSSIHGFFASKIISSRQDFAEKEESKESKEPSDTEAPSGPYR
ncbi:hypothetical protein [Legionella sp. km772]|uniref:hypothetical protein n=1 Tax=Legionella sp. km772 TaxID=2498111 RepID=UPI000F8D4A3B|nr:hypothetical protein [Legionella sp. km772]RUR13732.1 hypothetical protein ELY15_01505 [Legionella sp. km772]